MLRRRPMLTHQEFVWVELKSGLPIRIFHSEKLAYQSRADIGEMRRGSAIKHIRAQVVARAAGKCERCGEPVSEDAGEMHERQPRGMTGHVRGEYSVENSEFICRKCHNRAHANRRPQWTSR
jgi:hypothetical protein